VITDAELNRISHTVAEDIFGVVYDPDTFVLDTAATTARRADIRVDRLRRGRPFQEFVDEWVTAEPPQDLLYYGSWGDDTDEMTATVFDIDGPKRVTAPLGELPIIMMPDRREVAIARLEQRVRELEDKHGETVTRLS
jgi:hypothetical protein